MKTIFAFSDIHNATIPNWYRGVMAESDYIFFTGDGLGTLKLYIDDLSDKLYAVKGNCDYFNAPEELTVDVEGVRFLLVHGHRFNDKLDMVYRAKELNADVVLYGHTHSFSDEENDGVRLINIGSLSHSATLDVGYLYIVVNNKNISINFTKIC